MENNPKKSKALIITIIIIIFLLVIGFLVYKNRDKFGGGTSGIISKIFSPLAPSKNPKDLKTTLAQAGEDINAGDNLSISGYDANNNPIVIKAGNNSNIYGFANQDMLNGEFGPISINNGGSNSFFDSFSNFLNNLFDDNNNNNPNDLPPGGWSFSNELGIWEFDPNGIGGWVFDPNTGGWIPPGGSGNYNPQCSDTIDNDTDGVIDINDPNCHVGGTMNGDYLPNHYSESTNPLGGGGIDFTPQCSDTIDNDTDGVIDINDPNCHVGGTMDGDYLPNHYSESTNPFGGDLECENGAINPPLCTIFEEIYACSDEVDNDRDTLIDILDPACHRGNDINNTYIPTHNSEADAPCENGASNPPLCTIFEKEKNPDLTAGRITPTTALINTPTSLFSTVSNIGTGTTSISFPTLFTITNRNVDTGSEIKDDEISSKSKIKKMVLKIINKIPWISKATAATTINEGVDINVEISTTVPTIPPGSNAIATVSYTFTTPGMYYVRACADKDSIGNRGVIQETNEDNNCGPWTAFEATSSLPPPGELPQCSDGRDNDNDARTDALDPQCHIGGSLKEEYLPNHNSESQILEENLPVCSDNLDNDNDEKIDEQDPECHLGGVLDGTYMPNHFSETEYPIITTNQCFDVQQYPLEFNEEEKSKLAELLRKFYLLAPNLKTTDDINVIYNQISRNNEFIDQLTDLTNQCYAQGYNRNGGVNPLWDEKVPWGKVAGVEKIPSMHRFGNPWYKMKEKDPTQLYFDLNLIDTKLVSGYFSGTTKHWRVENKEIEKDLDCDEYFTPRPTSGYMGYEPKITKIEGVDTDYNKLAISFYVGGLAGVIWDVYLDRDPAFMWPYECKDVVHSSFSNNEKLDVCFTEALFAGCKWNGGTYYHQKERLLNIW